ncbi:Carboxylesterase [Mycena floridula]|nr:Carboxylesterase [Mycena floridula]
MVWIYGGGFSTGSATIYPGDPFVIQSIARGTPIIFVNFNYRLGPLGFPQGREPTSKGLLNAGLKDQLVAMEWVQRNIHYFGGSKDKVTIFGESAGAVSLGTLMLNRDLSKLARAMIVQSGSPPVLPNFDAISKQALWDEFTSIASPDCTDQENAISTCLAHSDLSAIHSAISATYLIRRSFHGVLPSTGLEVSFQNFLRNCMLEGKASRRCP